MLINAAVPKSIRSVEVQFAAAIHGEFFASWINRGTGFVPPPTPVIRERKAMGGIRLLRQTAEGHEATQTRRMEMGSSGKPMFEI
jgi:hypothetical protein